MEEIVNKNNEIVLFNDVCNIIDQTRNKIAVYVNTEVCLTNWYVGKRIKEDVLYNQRAEYGKQILKNLSKRLTEQYGSGWSIYKLQHCVRAAYTFTEDEIVYATRTQLSWTHLRSLMGVKDSLERQLVLCTNVYDRTLGYPYLGREDRSAAVPAHGHKQKTRRSY